MFNTSDRVTRAMTNNGAFRVITALTTQTVRGAVLAQQARGAIARRLGELMTGSILVREAMAPDKRVQILVKARDGRTSLVADAHPDGRNRGIVSPGLDERVAMVNNATLEVIYTLPNGIMHQGVVTLPDGGDISAGLMTYMHESEQIVSMIAVATVLDSDSDTGSSGRVGAFPVEDALTGGIRAAGGYMVQLIPGADRDTVAEMTARLEAADQLANTLVAADMSTTRLRCPLLGDMGVEDMTETLLRFGCNCDRERVLAGLSSLPRTEIEAMIAAGAPLDICCDACQRGYVIVVDELRSLLVGGSGSGLQN